MVAIGDLMISCPVKSMGAEEMLFFSHRRTTNVMMIVLERTNILMILSY